MKHLKLFVVILIGWIYFDGVIFHGVTACIFEWAHHQDRTMRFTSLHYRSAHPIEGILFFLSYLRLLKSVYLKNTLDLTALPLNLDCDSL